MSVIDHNHIIHIFYEAYFFSSHNTLPQIRYNHISSQLQFLRRICGSRSNFSSLRIGFSQMLSSFIKNLQMSTFTEMFRISIIITISFFIYLYMVSSSSCKTIFWISQYSLEALRPLLCRFPQGLPRSNPYSRTGGSGGFLRWF